MKKVIDEMKKHKKIMIGVAIVIVIGVWFMITNDPTPVVEAVAASVGCTGDGFICVVIRRHSNRSAPRRSM